MARKFIHKDLRPIIQPYDDKCMVVVEPFYFESFGVSIKIDKGYIFDGASIPRIAKSMISGSFDPEYVGPALIHDYLYTYKCDRNFPVSRAKADLVFKDCLRLNKVSTTERNAMYLVVRGGGMLAWRLKWDEKN